MITHRLADLERNCLALLTGEFRICITGLHFAMIESFNQNCHDIRYRKGIMQVCFMNQIYTDSARWCTGYHPLRRCVHIQRYASIGPGSRRITVCSAQPIPSTEDPLQFQDDVVVNDSRSFSEVLEKLGTLALGQESDDSTETTPDKVEMQQQHLQNLLGNVDGTALESEEIASTLLKSSAFSDVIFDRSNDFESGDMFNTLLEQERYSALNNPSHNLPETNSSVASSELDNREETEYDVLDTEKTSSSSAPVSNIDLSSKLLEVQQRRQTAERTEGEYSKLNTIIDKLAALPGEKEALLPLELSPSELEHRLLISSTKNARIISTDIHDDRTPYNSLTASAERLAFEQTQFPYRPRPILEIQKAFQDAESTNCGVCKRNVQKSDIEEGFFCSGCYSKIFVQIDSPTGALPQHKRLDGLTPSIRKTIDDVWEKKKLTLRKLSGGKIPFRAHTNFRNSASPPSAPSERRSQSGTSLASRNTGNSDSKAPSGPPGSPPPPSVSANGQGPERRDEWTVRASNRSLRTINPIRNLVQGIDVKPNPAKELIKLSVGDPTLYGNLKVSKKAVDEYCKVIQSMKHNGYSMSMGSLEARTAIAERYTLPSAPLTPDDVVLAGGTSGALELAIGALANEGDNILLPLPGFPLFRTIAEGFGIECRYYRLLPNDQWEIDLKHLATLADSRTAAIVVNNPSNPCGSVFKKEHIQQILKTASKLHLLVIADEVYADMVFSESEFTSIGSQSVDVPVISVGGISKQFVVPGWRLGWILLHDRNDLLKQGDVRKGIRQFTTRMLVPNSPAQAVVPYLLSGGVEDESFKAIMSELELNAKFTVKALAKAPGLRCIAPQGAMYTMAEIDSELLGFADDMEFTKALLREESVFVLPGQCFQAPNFIRIVFCAPQFVLSEAFHRIRRFCSRRAGLGGF